MASIDPEAPSLLASKFGICYGWEIPREGWIVGNVKSEKGWEKP